MAEVDKDKQLRKDGRSEVRFNSEVMVESKETTQKPGMMKAAARGLPPRSSRRYKEFNKKQNDEDEEDIEIGSKTLKPLSQDKSKAFFGLKPNMHDPSIE